MPLSSRAGIEIYLPDNRKKVYQKALKAVKNEFLETFGGCTIIKNIKGVYLSENKKADADKIILIYADTPFEFQKNRSVLSKYTDELRRVLPQTTEEESILIVVHEIYHSA